MAAESRPPDGIDELVNAESDSERTQVRRVAPQTQTAPVEHVLLLREDGAAARRIPLRATPLRIGRGAQNDLVLASPEVSRQHCTVGVSDGAAVLIDLGSTNGVHVDGARVRDLAVLPPGSRLAVGPFTLLYQRGSATELAEAEAHEHEQARAVSYIQSLLPLPLLDGPVRAAWRFVPSARLGGDVFGYRWLDQERFVVFLLDVSGHGLGSALLAVSAANMLRARAIGGADLADPVSVLHALNAAFQMDDHNGLFFTLWYGVYSLADRMIRYASAGHHPAYLSGSTGLQPLSTRAPGIGMAPRPKFRAAEAPVAPGALLHLFSDGVFEVKTGDGRDCGIDDLLPLLADAAPGRPAPDRIYDAMRELADRRPFEDDFSLITLAFP